MLERRKHLSFVLPDELVDPFYDELEDLQNEISTSVGKTDLLVKILAKHYKVNIKTAATVNVDPVVKSRSKVTPEDIAYRMEIGAYYSLNDLAIATQLSRTTVRNVVENNPEWFRVEGEKGKGARPYTLAKEVTKPSESKSKTKRKRKKKSKKRIPGLLSEKELKAVQRLRKNGYITQQEFDAYLTKYITDEYSQFDDYYNFDEEYLMDTLLPISDEVVEAVDKMLRSQKL